VLTYYSCILLILLLPLCASVFVGLMPSRFPRALAHQVTIAAMAVAFLLSLLLAKWFLWDHVAAKQFLLYTWGSSGSFQFNLGFLLDSLSTIMVLTVTFISLLVHIYSVGYMADDPGYARFFCYISFFTFAMLLLVSADNFLQLYFGWEGVGLASYLLIGFWFKKERANEGSLKAFLINRVGDFGFLLGIAAILNTFGTLNYGIIFSQVPAMADITMAILPNINWSVISVICILLFIGAMGKSAQMPLHVWLPESMEGPTPISALIHAATMVTAGVYMVSRMSSMFEYSPTALSVVLIVGATTALFTGILALVQNDIKRVIAYSTLSQLGYMVAALGASAYAASIFHLVTHACFKALLFLAAGSVIIALHHEQNIQKMGNLKRYLPLTYITFLVGALALSAIPPFSGFYSKDAIIEAVSVSEIFGAGYAYICLLLGTFITALYIFRAVFLVFYTDERIDPAIKKVNEPGWPFWVPCVVLAVPSVILGFVLNAPMLQANGILSRAVTVLPTHFSHQLYLTSTERFLLFWQRPSVWFALLGILVAWFTVVKQPNIRTRLIERFSWIYQLLLRKYGFDMFNQKVFVVGGKRLAAFLFNVADMRWLDGYVVNGTGHLIARFSQKLKRLQSGYLYHYVFAMILGLLVFLIGLFFYQ
jgi:NADH-quinone oxidoreductase subunit L